MVGVRETPLHKLPRLTGPSSRQQPMSPGFRRENRTMRYVLLALIISYVESLLPTFMKTFKIQDEGPRSPIRDRHYTCTYHAYLAIERKPSSLESMSCLIHMQLCELLFVHTMWGSMPSTPLIARWIAVISLNVISLAVKRRNMIYLNRCLQTLLRNCGHSSF